MFNDKFNDLLISEGNYNFRTYIYFQIYFLFYSKKLKLEEKFENNIELNYDLVDIFETVFLKIFVKNKNYRIYKVFYLFQLLIRLIVKK